MVAVGVPDETLNAHLQALIRFGLVLTDTQTALDEPMSITQDYDKVSSVHIAASGEYYLNTLCSRFQYLQRIIPDVPISDQSALNALQGILIPAKQKPFSLPMEQAVKSVETLVAYFDCEEQREHSDGVLSRDPVLSSVCFVDEIRRQLAPQLTAIERWLAKRDSYPH